MGLITTTVADFRIGSGSQLTTAQAGETVQPFQLLYLKDDNKYWKAINTGLATAKGLAFCASYGEADDNIGLILPSGDGIIESDSALWVEGKTYIVGSALGQMMLAGDTIAAASTVTIVGVAVDSTHLKFREFATGITHS